MRRPLVSQIIESVAKRAGVTVLLEPSFRYVGQITTPSGARRYFRNTCFDLNPLGASEIAKDKDYASFFMKQMGYPVVPGKAFYSDKLCKNTGSVRNIDAAYRYARRIGFPVMVKPNSLSQGRGVRKAWTRTEFYSAARFALAHDKIFLVQRVVSGHDYRIVVLDDRIISAYERLPLSVIGNGRSTIAQLLRAKQRAFAKAGRDTTIDMEDNRFRIRIRRQHLTMDSIIPAGETVQLLDNANLSTGGDAIDVTDNIHPAFKEIAVRLTHDMNLRLCGVDLMIDGLISEPPNTYWVLEINSAPGLDHYAATGQEQKEIVLALYEEVLRAMK